MSNTYLSVTLSFYIAKKVPFLSSSSTDSFTLKNINKKFYVIINNCTLTTSYKHKNNNENKNNSRKKGKTSQKLRG